MNKAIFLDGRSSYARIPVSATAGLTNFTFMFWIKTTESKYSNTNYQNPAMLGIGGGGSSHDVVLFTHRGAIGVYAENSSKTGHSVSNIYINDNKYHLIALTYDGSVFRVYVDGVLATSLSIPNTKLNSYYSYFLGVSHAYRFGDGMAESSSSYHQGSYDNLSVWNRPLSAEEIMQFGKRKPLGREDVTFFATFDDSDGTSAIDLITGTSFNLYNVTLKDSPIYLSNSKVLFLSNGKYYIYDEESLSWTELGLAPENKETLFKEQAVYDIQSINKEKLNRLAVYNDNNKIMIHAFKYKS